MFAIFWRGHKIASFNTAHIAASVAIARFTAYQLLNEVEVHHVGV